MINLTHYDVLVIGSGAAGLGLALSLADQFKIAVICKDNLQKSTSQHAQGGIAAVMSKTDSIESHIADTLLAGRGLCDPVTVEFTVRHAKEAISQLISYGIQFTTTHEEGQKVYHLTQEGGHRHRRILHAADKTGAAVVKTLLEQVREHPNIHCIIETTAFEAVVTNNQCHGVVVFNNQKESKETISAKAIVLATGGAAMTYSHTTNPGHTSGDGIAIAFNAGARIANMEFTQFHPTCFYNPGGEIILITESMRGEGAKLLLPDGTPFMEKYDTRKELAPRDIVSQAIDNELKTKQLPYVLLDISFESPEKIKSLFPNIYHKCLQYNIDITHEPIPVVPAAHYTCGGIITNLEGETDIKNLYAIGEVACTGLHGANRMASNSLLECLVFANSAASSIRNRLNAHPKKEPFPILQTYSEKHPKKASNEEISLLRKKLQSLMWNHVGIVRNNELLKNSLLKLKPIEEQFNAFWTTTSTTKDLLELKSMLLNAKLIIHSAIHRHESRGTHYNSDYPHEAPEALNTILIPTSDHKGLKIEFCNHIHSLIRR